MSFNVNGVEFSRDGKSVVTVDLTSNHYGEIDRMKRLIIVATDSGADFVKFQHRNPKLIYAPDLYNKRSDNPNWFGETYGEHREALEFSKDEWRDIVAFCDSHGVKWFSTPFDHDSVDFLEELGCPMYKIASGDATNTPLIRAVCEIGKPVIVSTGGCDVEDVHRIKETVDRYGSLHKFVLMQCACEYPSSPDTQNLNVINAYMDQGRYHDFIVGLSTHNPNWWVNIAAYALGARVFENHFTLARSWKGIDQAFSLTPDLLKEFTTALHEVERAMGSHDKVPEPAEASYTLERRRSLYANINMKSGENVHLGDIIALTPGGGIPPYELDQIIGQKLFKPLKKGDMLTREHLAVPAEYNRVEYIPEEWKPMKPVVAQSLVSSPLEIG
jgi:sialic acid synthase